MNTESNILETIIKAIQQTNVNKFFRENPDEVEGITADEWLSDEENFEYHFEPTCPAALEDAYRINEDTGELDSAMPENKGHPPVITINLDMVDNSFSSALCIWGTDMTIEVYQVKEDNSDTSTPALKKINYEDLPAYSYDWEGTLVITKGNTKYLVLISSD